MNEGLRKALLEYETDIEEAKKRFCGNEEFYVSCLTDFLSDTTVVELSKALDSSSWDEAFTAVHALKGLAANMGFIPLFHACSEMVVYIRKGDTEGAIASNKELMRCYVNIVSAIRENCSVKTEVTQGLDEEDSDE